MRCPNCGTTAGPDEIFCGECGTRLPAPPAVSAPPAPRRKGGTSPWIPLAVGGCILVVVLGCLALIAFGGAGALLAPGVVPVAQATPTNTPRPPSPTPRPTDTPQPSPTATITPPASKLVYQNDFSRETDDWPTRSGDGYSRKYVNGEYHITLQLENSVYRSMLARDLEDFDVQVDARLVEGPNTNAYGLLFRYQDGDNYYLFRVFPSGHYWLSKRVGGEWTTLIAKIESGYIHQGKETNRLRVECAGHWIRLYANDQYLNAVLDNTFREGQVGLAVSTWADGNVGAAFDNFKVWER